MTIDKHKNSFSNYNSDNNNNNYDNYNNNNSNSSNNYYCIIVTLIALKTLHNFNSFFSIYCNNYVVTFLIIRITMITLKIDMITGKEKKTLVAESNIEGYGLFLMEDVKKNTFIIEYKGICGCVMWWWVRLYMDVYVCEYVCMYVYFCIHNSS